MEESLQVYQQLSGPKDVNTLKCHVSQIVYSMGYLLSWVPLQKEYCRLLVLLEEHHVSVSSPPPPHPTPTQQSQQRKVVMEYHLEKFYLRNFNRFICHMPPSLCKPSNQGAFQLNHTSFVNTTKKGLQHWSSTGTMPSTCTITHGSRVKTLQCYSEYVYNIVNS